MTAPRSVFFGGCKKTNHITSNFKVFPFFPTKSSTVLYLENDVFARGFGSSYSPSMFSEAELETGPIVKHEPDIYFVVRLRPEI